MVLHNMLLLLDSATFDRPTSRSQLHARKNGLKFVKTLNSSDNIYAASEIVPLGR